MKTLRTKLSTLGCDGCPAKGPLAGQNLRVNAQARVFSQRVPAATYDSGGVVLTTVGHGTFLIRRRTTSGTNPCPLLDYEVRRIDAEGPSGRTPDRPAEKTALHRTTRADCHQLLKLAIARQV